MTLQNRFAPTIYFTELLLLDENSLSGTIPRELGNLLHAGKFIHTICNSSFTAPGAFSDPSTLTNDCQSISMNAAANGLANSI
jgi:hypothetical protein